MLLIFIILNILSANAQTKVFERAKLLAISDYEQFLHMEDSSFTDKIVQCEYLESKGFVNIDFIKVKIRDLDLLKLYMDTAFFNGASRTIMSVDSAKYKAEFEKHFDASLISNIDFYEEKIGKNKFVNNEIQFQCDFVLAHLKYSDQLLRLKGFRVNDFREFLFDNLHPPSIYLNPSIAYDLVKIKKWQKKLTSAVRISEVDLGYLYNEFIEKNSILDKKSCYLRDIILYYRAN